MCIKSNRINIKMYVYYIHACDGNTASWNESSRHDGGKREHFLSKQHPLEQHPFFSPAPRCHNWLHTLITQSTLYSAIWQIHQKQLLREKRQKFLWFLPISKWENQTRSQSCIGCLVLRHVSEPRTPYVQLHRWGWNVLALPVWVDNEAGCY